MINYIVEPKSRKDIRECTITLRRDMKLEKKLWIPVVELLDSLSISFDSFSYEIVDDSELQYYTHAETDIITGHIKIKQSVYNGACDGKGRDRMTIAHEIGHWYTICICGFKFQPNRLLIGTAYMDPEWQAKCFAGEFMIPFDLTKGMTAEEIAQKCGVSLDAARIQLKCFEKDR